MDETSVTAASRRSTRKRKTAREKYSPPPVNRKRVSDVYQVSTGTPTAEDDALVMQKNGRDRSSEANELQNKFKKVIKKEDSEIGQISDIEDDSGTYDTSSVSELGDSDEVSPPKLYSVLALPGGRKSIEQVESVSKSSSNNNEVRPQLLKQKAAASPSPISDGVIRPGKKDSARGIARAIKPTTNETKSDVNFIQENLRELQKLNPALCISALKKPIQQGDTLIVVVKLLETLSFPSTSDTVVPFLQDAENESRKFIQDLPLPLQKPRIVLEKAWEAIAVTYGLYGPTVVPIILHFIKQQNMLETKYFNNPAALFTYTLMIVKLFHENLMQLLSPQISITHTWILDILEQPFLRSYLTLVQWINYFEPRMSQVLISDPSIEAYKVVTNFMNKFVTDPYSSFLTEIKRNPLFTSNKVVILLPLISLADDKLSLIALLFRGLDNLGCTIKLYKSEQDIIKEYESIKAANQKSYVFGSEFSLQTTHSSPTFGALCFSFNFVLQSMEPSNVVGRPKKLKLSTSNSDGTVINEDILVNNNITPACICRYYLEHITNFIESFIKEEEKE